MKVLRTAIGGTIAGLMAGGVWGQFAAERYGIIGGWFAAFVIISSMWFMNHYSGLYSNEDGAGFVDMALSIGVTCIVRDVILNGTGELGASLVTMVLVSIGGVIGGYLAFVCNKSMAEEKKQAEQEA